MSLDFIKQNPNYTEDTYSLILDQFANKEYYKKFVNTLIYVQQDYERLLVELATSRRLPLAVGEQLTEIGEQQGLVRRTDDDNDFRAAIYLSSIKRRSDGTRDVIVQALLTSSGELPYIYSGLYRMVDITVNGQVIPSINTINEITSLLPVNTAYRILKSPRSGKPFGFDGNTKAGGFASRIVGTSENCGSMCSLKAYIEKPKLNDPTFLPYIVPGYVEEGYVE